MTKHNTIENHLSELAAAGDLDGLVDLLSGWRAPDISGATQAQALREAISVHAQGGPEDLIDLAFRRMLAHNTELLVRSHVMVNTAIRHHDQQRGVSDLPAHVADVLLVHQERIEDHVVGLARTYATLRHTLALGREGRKTRTQRRADTDSAALANRLRVVESHSQEMCEIEERRHGTGA